MSPQMRGSHKKLATLSTKITTFQDTKKDKVKTKKAKMEEIKKIKK